MVFSRQAYSPATSSSGASEANGATHWTRKNWLMPSSVPVSTRESAKCSAHARMTAAATTNRPMYQARRGAAVFSPTHAEGPISSGSSAGARATRML